MIKLVRVDYRLLHGQVVFAWCKALNIERIIIIDTETATSEFKKMSLGLTKPPGIKLNILSLDDFIEKSGKIHSLADNTMLIFGDTKTLLAAYPHLSTIKEVNYGVIPKKEGSKQYSQAIYLTAEELEDSVALSQYGVQIVMQQVPSSKRESLNSMIG